jgi:hypothetical protein
MMDVMVFDTNRRGQIISQTELSEYSHKLAKAVTEAIYYLQYVKNLKQLIQMGASGSLF